MKKKICAKAVAIVSLVLVFVFMAIASGFNNDWGKIEITDIYYPNSEGGIIHAQLFVPEGASSAEPLPAILNMHGGSDYLQTVTNYTIELARRGYVILTVDAYGSGSSDFVNGAVASNAGGADGKSSALIMDGGASTGIEQLLSYKFVDSSRIGLTGHSMGGTYIANAALAFPENVKAIMPWGSGSFIDKMKASNPADYKFNVGYISATSDEMGYFALHDKTVTLLSSAELQNFFSTDETIVPGKTYGDFAEGTGRVIYTPDTNHIGNIICKDSIGAMADFFSKAMPSGTTLSADDQVWMYKELFCVLATVALLVFAASLGFVLIDTAAFSGLVVKEAGSGNAPKAVSIIGILCAIAVPALTLHKVGLNIATKPATKLMPFNWANNLLWLAVVNSAIILVIFLVLFFAFGKKKGMKIQGFTDGSAAIGICKILKALLFSVVLMTCVFFVVNLCYNMFKIDFRFWQFGIMPITLKRFAHVLPYFLLLAFSFLVLDVVSVSLLSVGSESSCKCSVLKDYGISWLIGAGGYLIILAIYYIGLTVNQKPPLFFAFPPFAGGHPNSLVFSMKTTVLVPTFTLISLLNTALYRKTKNIYVGCFATAILGALILIGTNAFAI